MTGRKVITFLFALTNQYNLAFQNKDKLKTYVIASGIIYGAEEADLMFLFKLTWNNEKEMPIFLSGKNSVPLIHVKDLAK